MYNEDLPRYLGTQRRRGLGEQRTHSLHRGLKLSRLRLRGLHGHRHAARGQSCPNVGKAIASIDRESNLSSRMGFPFGCGATLLIFLLPRHQSVN